MGIESDTERVAEDARALDQTIRKIRGWLHRGGS
jgi:hypothetical protein